MYNIQYLLEKFEQCRLEKTILRHFTYNLKVLSRWNALIQDGGKNHERAYCYDQKTLNINKNIGKISIQGSRNEAEK